MATKKTSSKTAKKAAKKTSAAPAKKAAKKAPAKKAGVAKKATAKKAAAPAKKAGAPAKKAGAPTKKAASTRYTSVQVFDILCKKVYPPCAKAPAEIMPDDQLGPDLGYVGSSVGVLAAKTNIAFDFKAPDWFKSTDFKETMTVEQHHAAVCALLRKLGRLEE
jgi:hypothetical protein